MKILLLVTGMPDKNKLGCSTFNLKYVECLTKKGYFVTLINFRYFRPFKPLIREIDSEGYTRFDVFCFFPKYFWGGFFSKLFKIVLNQLLIDVDIIHGVGGGTLRAADLMASALRKPFIIQFIGSDINQLLDMYLRSDYFLNSLNRASFIGFNSKALMIEFQKKAFVDVSMAVIYRGVNLTEFPFNYDHTDQLRILFLGGAPSGDSKGAFTMAEVCQKLIGRYNSDSFIDIRLAGPNIDVVRSRIGPFENTKISINIIGSLSSKDVVDELQRSNIVVIPSDSEGVPNVLFEAMATGNIIVATNVGGITEFIDHGVTGYLIDKKSADNIISVLDKIANSVDRKAIVLNARNLIENYNYDNFINAYVAKYSQIINQI